MKKIANFSNIDYSKKIDTSKPILKVANWTIDSVNSEGILKIKFSDPLNV